MNRYIYLLLCFLPTGVIGEFRLMSLFGENETTAYGQGLVEMRINNTSFEWLNVAGSNNTWRQNEADFVCFMLNYTKALKFHPHPITINNNSLPYYQLNCSAKAVENCTIRRFFNEDYKDAAYVNCRDTGTRSIDFLFFFH